MSRPLLTLFGIPVTVSLWHPLWLFLLLGGPAARHFGPAGAALVILLASLSVLGHEFGHGMVSKFFGLQPEIELVSLGGLCKHLPARKPWHNFAIVVAGPLMNFVIAGVALLAEAFLPEDAVQFAAWLSMINIFWGIYNLLPVWPLDGGRILGIGLQKLLKPVRAERWTHIVSIATAALVGVFLFRQGSMFGAVFLLMAAVQNWQMLQHVEQSPDAKAVQKHSRVRELIAEAREAFALENYPETARLAHLARAEPYLNSEEMTHVWQLLALAAAHQEQFEEAVRFAERVPNSPDMAAILAFSLAAIGDRQRIRQFLASPAAILLPGERVEHLQQVARTA